MRNLQSALWLALPACRTVNGWFCRLESALGSPCRAGRQLGYAMSAVVRCSRWSVVAPFRGDGRIEGSKKALAGKVRIP